MTLLDWLIVILRVAVPALMVMSGVVAMVVQMPAHPNWMSIAGLLLPIPAAMAGALLATKLGPAR